MSYPSDCPPHQGRSGHCVGQIRHVGRLAPRGVALLVRAARAGGAHGGGADVHCARACGACVRLESAPGPPATAASITTTAAGHVNVWAGWFCWTTRTAGADLGQEHVPRVSVEAREDEHPPAAVRDAERPRVEDAVGPAVAEALQLADDEVHRGRLGAEAVLQQGVVWKRCEMLCANGKGLSTCRGSAAGDRVDGRRDWPSAGPGRGRTRSPGTFSRRTHCTRFCSSRRKTWLTRPVFLPRIPWRVWCEE